MKNAVIQLLIICCIVSTSYAGTIENINSNSNATKCSDTRTKFRVGFDAPQINHRQLLLTIDANTTDGIDYGYDAEMYQMIEDDMYWLLEDRKFVIQATNEVFINKEFPLGIVMSGSGDVEIKIDELENPISDIVVYLKDKELNKLYNIQDSVYKSALPQGEYHSRFVITFKSSDFVNNEAEDSTNDETPIVNNPNSVLGNEDYSLIENELSNTKLIEVFYNNEINSIILNNESELTIEKIDFFNKIGSKLKTWRKYSKKERVVLPVHFNIGMYFVIVKTENKLFRKKILIR